MEATKANPYAYVALFVKARAMLIDAGRYDDVARLERLRTELLPPVDWEPRDHWGEGR